MNHLPNLILAGAPKCGTTSLFSWLNDHPDVCGANAKETFYLMDKDNPLARPQHSFYSSGLNGYKLFFENCQTQKITVEATAQYIYQNTAIEVLSNLSPLPNIIFLLRNPSMRVYSLYNYIFNNLARLHYPVSFSQLVQIVLDDSSQILEDYCDPRSHYLLSNSIKHSCYINFISRWFSYFPREHIHVFLFEDMIKDPLRIMEKIAKISNIDPQFYNDYNFSTKNKTLYIRNIHFHRGIKFVSRNLPSVFSNNTFFRRLYEVYLKIQSQNKTPQISSEDQKTISLLGDYFRPFNLRLASKINIDINSWNCYGL